MKYTYYFLLFAFAVNSATSASAERPNIVVILTDDQGYADISLNPHHPAEVSTPNMDALAEDGVVFSQGYTGGPVCSPTRAGIMIGGYSQSIGVYTAGDGGAGFDPRKKIFPGYLPDDYVSSAIGKWHLGVDDDYPELKWHALNRGFDECYKFMGRGGHSYFNLRSDVKGKFMGPIYRNKERINDEGYMTTRLTEEAVAFIDRNKEKPFFLYLAYNAVHAPAEAPEEDIKAFQAKFPQLSRERAILMAMLKHLDDGVGEVVGKLKREGIFDNTLLFFLTDNGGSKSMSADNTPLRGFKQTLDEGGIRTPFIVSWPDRFKGGRTVDTPIISFDILPTALDAVEATPATHDFAGKSLLPLLTGESTQHHDTLFWSLGPDNEWAVRRDDWKLHWIKSRLELVNLAKDPSEQENLADGNPEKVKELSNAFDQWLEEMPDPIKGGPKRKDGLQKTGTVSAQNKNMTPRDIERARIREEKQAAKKAAKEKEKAMKKAKKKSPDEDTPQPTATRPVIKVPVTNVSGPHPGGRFDLSQWKLTLPYDQAHNYGGHAMEVGAKLLTEEFKDPHFLMDADGAMVFWCPVIGSTTEGTQFPRCELREMLKPDDPSANWTSKGRHALTARCRVLQVPSNPKVVIGQIHSHSGKAKPLVKLQFYKGRIEALVKSSPTKGKDIKLVWPEVGLDGDIEYEIIVHDDVLSLKVNGVTQTQNIVENDPRWLDQTFYFKAGAYPQDNAGPATEGARVSFSDLRVIHEDV
ncbi:MAG: polysaccharide lyase family 7 protein [Rubripirellula sp.]